jgi:hypothetical protein
MQRQTQATLKHHQEEALALAVEALEEAEVVMKTVEEISLVVADMSTMMTLREIRRCRKTQIGRSSHTMTFSDDNKTSLQQLSTLITLA